MPSQNYPVINANRRRCQQQAETELFQAEVRVARQIRAQAASTGGCTWTQALIAAREVVHKLNPCHAH